MSKTKHPANRRERLVVKVKKQKKYDNTSAVYRLLKEKELLDEEGSGLPRDRDTHVIGKYQELS